MDKEVFAWRGIDVNEMLVVRVRGNFAEEMHFLERGLRD
jgi:hypothetical protein